MLPINIRRTLTCLGVSLLLGSFLALSNWMLPGAIFPTAAAVGIGRTPHQVSAGSPGTVPAGASTARLPSPELQAQYPWLEGRARVRMKFTQTDPFEVEIYGDHAPITAGHFIDMVSEGHYRDIAISPDFPFILRILAPDYTDPDGNIRRIPLEIQAEDSSIIRYGSTFYDRFFDGHPVLRNGYRGAIAIAHTEGSPNDGCAQLFISYGNPNYIPFDGNDLDGNYAVFGYISDDAIDYYDPENDVLDHIKQGDRLEYIEIVSGLEGLHLPE